MMACFSNFLRVGKERHSGVLKPSVALCLKPVNSDITLPYRSHLVFFTSISLTAYIEQTHGTNKVQVHNIVSCNLKRKPDGEQRSTCGLLVWVLA